MTNALISSMLENRSETDIITLQNIVLPNLAICTVEELFIRLNQNCLLDYEQGSVELKTGGIVRCDTYFNSFSAQKWKSHTNLKKISINLSLKGKLKVSLLSIDCNLGFEILVSQKIIEIENLTEVCLFKNIDIQPQKGLLYIEVEALEDDCLFAGGYIYTNSSHTKNNSQKFAIVICTYKRETYIDKNIQILQDHLLSNSKIGKDFEVFIIDNGRTLNNFSHSQIHLIPNKNAGGSGGYTRGIIEVLERGDEFSHVIFMDDDVVIDPEVFIRIHSFQSFLNNKAMCIGGSMLKLDSKYMQHENGAIWDQEVIRLKPDIDLRSIRNVLLNEVEEYLNYNGWWLFCFPIQLIDRDNLPYPFFIKMDDMELPIRLQCQIATLNGICVWHEPLENKYSPMMNYYLRRNEMILNALSSDSFGTMSAIKKVLQYSFREAYCYRYKSAALVLTAIADFLRGPDYIKSIDPEKKNLEITSLGEKAVQNPELPFIYGKYDESIRETENTFHRWFRLITLNGHLLPSFLFHDDTKLVKQGYRIVPIQGYRPIHVFRAKSVLYYHLVNQEGFCVRFSRTEFFWIVIQTFLIAWRLFFRFPKLKQSYRKTRPEMTNVKFWERYLEIDQCPQSK